MDDKLIAALLKEFDIHYEIDKLGDLETP